MSLPVSSVEIVPTHPTVQSSIMFAVLGRLRDAATNLFKQGKPWTEVVDKNTFSKPANFSEATSRLKKNLAYFRMNYLLIILITIVLTFLMHPSSLFVVGLLCSAWVYVLVIRTTPLTIGGRTLSHNEKLYGMAAVSFITIFFLTSVGTMLFSAVSFSLVVVALHGAMRQPDDLFIDDVESSQGFLGGIFGPPPVATHSTAV